MSLNKVQLIGNVGQEPTLREFDNGGCLCSLTIATTDRGFTTKDGRKIEEKTEWHNVVFKNSLAKVIQKYVHKGDKIYVEGKLTTRTYLKDDEKRYVTEIVASDFEFMQNGKVGGNSPAAGTTTTTTGGGSYYIPNPFDDDNPF